MPSRIQAPPVIPRHLSTRARASGTSYYFTGYAGDERAMTSSEVSPNSSGGRMPRHRR